MASATDTKEMIMAAARLSVQSRGYNALSFRDLAAEVGIKSASIHYYFPTKTDLAVALARRYTEDLATYLKGLLEQHPDTSSRLRAYTEVFRASLLRGNRMCLCGMLAAERDDLAPEVRTEVEKFNEANVDWLVGVLASERPGADETEIRRWAFAVLSAVEGAQLVSRGCGDIGIYDRTIEAFRTSRFIP